MKTSEQIDQIATALAAAQAEITNPHKDAENPHFKSSYADLAGGLSVARPALSKQGISIIQATSIDAEVMMLETRLAHKSGQWIACDYPVIKFPAPQQQIGSALTYARRYSLFALVGIAGEDDDGNAASQKDTPAPPSRAAIDQSQVSVIDALLAETGADRDRFCSFFKIGSVSQLSAGMFKDAVSMLEAKRKPKEAVQ